MDASVSCFRSATFLRYLLAASLLLLLIPVPSVVRASSDGTIDKLAEQVRQQVADSRTKARPAARPSTGILIDRELSKLERYAGEQFTRSATKDKPAPARRLVLERLLTKLHDRAAVNVLAARRKAGTQPRPARRAAVALQTSAEQISYGDTSQGSVLVASETVRYSFTGVAGDIVDIALSSDDFDTYLELHFEGESIVVNDDGGGGLNSRIEGFFLPADGDYTIVARAFDSDTGSFVLSLASPASAILHGGTISAGVTSSDLQIVGQVTLYHFTLDALATVDIQLTALDFDTYLRLFAGSGVADRTTDNLLLLDDDGGGGTNSRITDALLAGDYLIEVGAFSGAGSGSFDLDIAVGDVDADEDLNGAVAIAADTTSGGLFPAGDTDLYSFTGEAGDVVDIAIDSDDFDPVLEVEVDGEVIGFNDDGGGDGNSLLAGFVLPVSGTYLVHVRAFATSQSGQYFLRFTETSSAFTVVGLVPQGQYEGSLDLGVSIHLYVVDLTVATTLRATLVSTDFDAFLVLYEGSGLADRTPENRIAVDDDGGGDLNSLLEQFVGAGQYLLEVRSFHTTATGGYVLDLDLVVSEDEDAADPVAIAAGDTLAGDIFPPGETDTYSFAGVAGDVVDIGVVSADLDPVLIVLVDGDTIAFNDDGGVGQNSLLNGFVLPASGDYVLQVRPFGAGEEGTYEVSLVNVTPPLTLFDALTPGLVNGTIETVGQIDLYPLLLTATTEVQLDLTADNFDTFLSLYRGDGSSARGAENLLASDDDGGSGLNSRLNLVLVSGSYVVEARPLFSVTGEYELTLTSASLAADEDAGGAVALVFGDSLTGRLDPFGDVDSYRFEGGAGDVVDIVSFSDSVDTFLELQTGGAIIGNDDDSGVDLNARLQAFVLPVDGSYDLLVRASDRGTGAYGLQLIDLTPAATIFDALATGLVASSLDSVGGLHLYRMQIDSRSSAELNLVSSAFDPLLELYRGSSVADRVAENLVVSDDNGDGALNAVIALDLRPGSYLVVVRDAGNTGTGAYSLQYKRVVVPPLRSTLAVLSGTLNESSLNPLDPVIEVDASSKITGQIRLALDNTHASNEVFAVGATPTWGAASESWWEVVAWASAGASEIMLDVDLSAPAEPGTYHVLVAGANELTAADVMSGTHFESSGPELFGDADDVAVWGAARIAAAVVDGWVSVEWYSDYSAEIAATAIRIEVLESSVVPRGPILIDFDSSAGNQRLQRTVIDGPGERIELQLHADDMREVNGWSVLLRYDPDQLAYVDGSFAPGDFIPGLIGLTSQIDDVLEVGGTVLGTDATNEGSGWLGSLAFDVLDGFSFSSSLVIEQVKLRVPGQGRLKQEVNSRGILNEATPDLVAGPVAMDLDGAPQDQGMRRLEGVAAGDRVDVALHVEAAPELSGWSARLEFDPSLLSYVGGSFRAGDFIPGLIPLVGDKETRVDVGGVVLGGSATGSGDALLGTLAFELSEAFVDSAEITVTRVSFNTTASGEVIEQVRHSIVLAVGADAVDGDFSGDGILGADAVDGDFNGDGIVDFSDFFRFADFFGADAGKRSRLMELAVLHIGLPWAALVEQNVPNPFNAETMIGYHVFRAAQIELHIYDIAGQRVRVLREGVRAAGGYRARWDSRDDDGRRVSSGVYLYRIVTPGAEGILGPRKMLLLR